MNACKNAVLVHKCESEDSALSLCKLLLIAAEQDASRFRSADYRPFRPRFFGGITDRRSFPR